MNYFSRVYGINFNFLHLHYEFQANAFVPDLNTPVKSVNTLQHNVLSSTTASRVSSTATQTTSTVSGGAPAAEAPSMPKQLVSILTTFIHSHFITAKLQDIDEVYRCYGGRPEIFYPVFRATLRAISEGRRVVYEQKVDGRKVAVIVVR